MAAELKPAHCCKVGCDKPAILWVGTQEIEDYSHSCEDHALELAETFDETKVKIYPLAQPTNPF